MSKFEQIQRQIGSKVSKGPFYQFHPAFGNRFALIQGKPRFAAYDEHHLNHVLTDHVIDENDVVICSFYKTGTHWLKKILLEIMAHHELTKNVPRFQTIDLSQRNISNLDTAPVAQPIDGYPRIYHNHLHFDDLSRVKEIHQKAKLIYITRNPKDVAVSMHDMLTNLPILQYDGDYATSIEMFLNGFTPCGDFWDHVKGWNDVYTQGEYNMLWLYYEDLVADPLKYIQLIVEHIGLPTDGLSEQDYASIEDRTKFQNVKQELMDNPGNFYEFLDLPPEKFFRKGTVGDWNNHFDAKMAHYYDVKSLIKWNQNPGIKYYQLLLQQNPNLQVHYD